MRTRLSPSAVDAAARASSTAATPSHRYQGSTSSATEKVVP